MKRRLLRLTLWLLALLLLLSAAEYASVLWLDHRSTHYLVPGETNGSPAWVDNPLFPLRFALPRAAGLPPPMASVRDSEDRAYRVALLTDSTPLGPAAHSADHAYPRQLEALLRARCPDIPVEVLHMTCPGANSHVLREIARDLRLLRPDAVVILCGNDELTGPCGPCAPPAVAPAPWPLHPGPTFARPFVLFSRLRLAQAITALAARIAPDRADRAVWQSREPQLLGPWLRPDADALADARDAYSDNLDAILDLARDASPVVIACTTPVNLRDCPPFATAWSPDPDASQLDREALFRAVANEETYPDESARLYDTILHRTPGHAEALYRSGLLTLRRGHPDEAARRLSAARDSDACRVRCDSTFNLLMANAADRADVTLLDTAAIFAGQSEGRSPGRELFLDAVHMTFEGHYLLASSILESLDALDALPDGPTADLHHAASTPAPHPDAAALADALLYTPWGHAADLAAVIANFREPPYRNQPGQPAAIDRLKAEKARTDAQVAALASVASAIHSRRLAASSNDSVLAAAASRFFISADDLEAAATVADTAIRTWPHRPDIRTLRIIPDLLRRNPDNEAAIALSESLTDPAADPIGDHVFAHLYIIDTETKRPSNEIGDDARNFDDELKDEINDRLAAWVAALPAADFAAADSAPPWPVDLVAATRAAQALHDTAAAAHVTASNAFVAATNAMAAVQAELAEAYKNADDAAAEFKASQVALEKARTTDSKDPLAASQALSDLIRKTDALQSRELSARTSARLIAQRVPPAEAEVESARSALAAAEADFEAARREQGGAIRDLRRAWLRDREKLVAAAPDTGDDRIDWLDIPGLWGPRYPEVHALRARAANKAAKAARQAYDSTHAELLQLDARRTERFNDFRTVAISRIFDETIPALLLPPGTTDIPSSLPVPTPLDLNAAQAIGDALFNRYLHALAIPWYRYIISCDPNRTDAVIALARSLDYLLLTDEAGSILESASSRLPFNPDILEVLGFHLRLLRESEPSDAAWARADSLIPFRYSRYFWRAYALHENRLAPFAWRALARYLEFYPDDPDALSLRSEIEPYLPDDFVPEEKPTSASKTSILDSLTE